ncbi:MAG: aminotransferase class V-fold PLP-dependent enzyme [Chitinophagales bacterium]|nr:aminotransferase class V-fold PLP-dependent enzyme [Chitinophagales bacterium]
MKRISYSPLIKHWNLDQSVTFLNHGSFGACPIPILEKQNEYRMRLEQEPVKFMVRELENLIWESKTALGNFIHAKPEDFIFISNATTGVNTVLSSLRFEEGDELLTTNHCYGACLNAAKWFCEKAKANVVVANVPFPITSAAEVTEAILKCVTPKTKLVMIDHITSPTGIIFPVKEIVTALSERGIDCLVDGAHAPGMLDLNLEEIGAAYYTGNCHKWICSPKGSALLHVRKDKQHLIHPISVSHNYDVPESNQKQWSSNFFWPGTNDYSSYLCVKDAIAFMGNLFEGGWKDLRAHNHDLALNGRKMLAEKMNTPLPAPDEMIGSLANIFLSPTKLPAYGFNYIDLLQNKLWDQFKIEVPVIIWSRNEPRLWFRISGQCYNTMEQYEYLGEALSELIK